MSYITQVLIHTLLQLTLLFGGIFLIAFTMYLISSNIRAIGTRRFGMGYYYFVAPGIACHELGHALGCLLTFTRIHRVALFSPQKDGTLGSVEYYRHKSLFGRCSEFFIATGPIWFGCAAIVLLTHLIMPNELQSLLFGGDRYSELDSVLHILKVSFSLALNLLLPWKWTSIWSPLYLYLIFCIASEITLSPVDVKGAAFGFALICFFVFLFNLFTGGYTATEACFAFVSDFYLVVYAVLLFVLILDYLMLRMMKLIG